MGTKRKRIKYRCSNCDTIISDLGACEESILYCAVCKSSHMVAYDGKELKTSVRFMRAGMEVSEDINNSA